LNASHEYNSNSLAAVLHINKSNAAGYSKRLYPPAIADRSFQEIIQQLYNNCQPWTM